LQQTRKSPAVASAALSARRLPSWPTAIVCFAFATILVWQLARVGDDYPQIVKDYESHLPRLGGSDFPAFYMGAKLFVTDPAHAYDETAQARTILELKGYGDDLSQDSTWYRYYNPPAFSFLWARSPSWICARHTSSPRRSTSWLWSSSAH
jgi:hypothetical protein